MMDNFEILAKALMANLAEIHKITTYLLEPEYNAHIGLPPRLESTTQVWVSDLVEV